VFTEHWTISFSVSSSLEIRNLLGSQISPFQLALELLAGTSNIKTSLIIITKIDCIGILHYETLTFADESNCQKSLPRSA